MTSFIISPEMAAMIRKAKESGGTVQCDPRMMYAVGHECAARTHTTRPPVTNGAWLIQQPKPTRDGGKVLEIETANGDTVEATTDANGALTKVDVKNKWLVPALLVGSFFLFGG